MAWQIELNDMSRVLLSISINEREIVRKKRSEMLTVQGTCLCLSGQGQGSVVYCYGDPAARNLNTLQEEFETEEGLENLSPENILALTQISVITLGMLAMWVLLCLDQ